VPMPWIYGTDIEQEQSKVFSCCVKCIEDILILDLMVRKFTYRRCVDFHFFSLNFPSLSSNEIHSATIKPKAGEESSLEKSNLISESYFSCFSLPYPPR
jgi:hypothetical protein